MKRLLTLFFVFTVALLISSCATISPNQKKLIGSWKAVKVEKYNVLNAPSQTAEAGQKNDSSTVEYTESQIAALQSSKMEEQRKRIVIKSELHSILTINANKTATKELQGKIIHATWKLKNNGTRLLIDSKETDRNMILEIQHITDTSAVVVETLPVGDFKITYKKEKK